MAVLGLGTDIVEVERFDKMRCLQAFADRVLTSQEHLRFNESKFQARFLAKRFAAKEAAAKALGTGFACGVTFQDLDISNDELGKPILTLVGKAKEIADSMGVSRCLVSISDEKNYSVATVILEG
ncbi:holo-ACP synthase [Veronia nyctiphanis]|uniref:Holo-[acyl-carrier-protein] synthase n=1 Tax=Veronia nyctiphanis TaxID=1278244 RepID=A0A4Q0YN18_9GAMM|nr:holo-ACP synthase [Veronia nyctiphanis]RXJ72312.1 holo-ACP synthase [Veronia nyctiphanis]